MLPILREAGGRFTDWRGASTVWNGDGVATNAALHEPVLEILRSEARRDT
jgi:fructose-1,6-bisphosphatase/inositol monophosphatase family enzyme